MKIPTFILDDEPHCTDLLQVMAAKYCPNIQVVGGSNDPEEALPMLQSNPPGLLFLDIEMPRLNGFDFLERLGTVPFKVVFTTAYDQYAVRAFKFNALDYLLKPIDRAELEKAVARVLVGPEPSMERIQATGALRTGVPPTRIALPLGQEWVFVEVPDILYCESEGSYVRVWLVGQPRPILLSRSLREFEELLNNPNFFRTHNSYLINLDHIQKIVKSDGGEIIMRNGKSIPIARAKKQELLNRIPRL